MFNSRSLFTAALAFCFLPLIVACGGGNQGSSNSVARATPAPTSTASPTPTPPPVIQVVSPSAIIAGASIFQVEIYGQNFPIGGKVLLDGSPVATVGSAQVAHVSPNPNAAPGVHTFTIEAQDGTKSNAATYVVFALTPGPQPFLANSSFYQGVYTDPAGLAVADFDGDGFADVAVIYGPANSALFLFKGMPDGSLRSPVRIELPARTDATGLVAGDLNGDGHPDLVIACETSYVVMLNDGTGNFQVASDVLLPNTAFYQPFLADFDGDGKPDLVLTAAGGFSTQLFPGLGGGLFGPPQSLGAAVPAVNTFRIADFNNDSLPDAVYSDQSYALHLLLNQGHFSFKDSVILANSDVADPGDFNRDGNMDLLVQTVDHSGDVQMQTYLGNGNGTFSAQGSPVAISEPGFRVYTLVPGDFDHDGNLDLAGIDGEVEPSHILYLFGDGAGNFTPKRVNTAEGTLVATGDINHDGIPDVVLGDRFNYATVSLGRADRKLPTPTSLTLTQGPGGLSAADINNDGLTDLFATGAVNSGGFLVLGPGQVFMNNGDGTFTTVAPTPVGLLIADLNGDGLADLVGVQGNNVLIWPGDGSGTFNTSPISIPVTQGTVADGLVVRDMDKDGHPDIIGDGFILYGKGNFQFQEAAWATTAPGGPPIIGDFNGDGLLDIAVPYGVFLAQPGRTFLQVPNSSLPSGTLPTYAVADFNGDGMDDIAVTDEVDGGTVVDIYASRGDGTFLSWSLFDCMQPTGGMTALDFDGDGRPDLAVGSINAQEIVLFRNNGDGSFAVSYVGSGASVLQLITADFNKDGKPDLAYVNYALDFRPPNALVMFHK